MNLIFFLYWLLFRFRGFAFVVFKTISSLQDAVNEQEHSVKGKKVAVKKAKAKEGKIYVGKLKPELSDEEIKNHFAQFGNISQVVKSLAPILSCFINNTVFCRSSSHLTKLRMRGKISVSSHLRRKSLPSSSSRLAPPPSMVSSLR